MYRVFCLWQVSFSGLPLGPVSQASLSGRRGGKKKTEIISFANHLSQAMKFRRPAASPVPFKGEGEGELGGGSEVSLKGDIYER